MTIDDIQSDFFEGVFNENIIVTEILNEQLTSILKEYIITNKQIVLKDNTDNATIINPSIVLMQGSESQKALICITVSLANRVIIISVTYR